MGDEEAAAELVAAPVDQLFERDRGGVGRDRRAGLLQLFKPCIKVLLDVQPLDDGLDDPVAFGDAFEVIVDVAGLDQLRRSLRHEGGGIGLEHLRDRALGHGIAVVTLLRHDVEQQHRHARIGDLRRDPCAHGARADDADFLR